MSSEDSISAQSPSSKKKLVIALFTSLVVVCVLVCGGFYLNRAFNAVEDDKKGEETGGNGAAVTPGSGPEVVEDEALDTTDESKYLLDESIKEKFKLVLGDIAKKEEEEEVVAVVEDEKHDDEENFEDNHCQEHFKFLYDFFSWMGFSTSRN